MYRRVSTCRSSRGFLLPLAAVLLVGFAILAIAINRFAGYSSSSSVLEALSVQAFYAAESGAYQGMNRLMFDVDDRSIADANCSAIDGGPVVIFSVAGLNSCTAALSCSVATVAGSSQHFYTIRSVGRCGSGELSTERTVQLASYL